MWRPIDWRMRESGPLVPAGISTAAAAGAGAASARPSRDFGLRGAAGASGR